MSTSTKRNLTLSPQKRALLASLPDALMALWLKLLGDAAVAAEMSRRMLEEGVYVIGFSHPVVPVGKARIRTQVSAAHTREDLDFAVGETSEGAF